MILELAALEAFDSILLCLYRQVVLIVQGLIIVQYKLPAPTQFHTSALSERSTSVLPSSAKQPEALAEAEP